MLIGIDANEANLTTNRVGINQYAYNVLKSLWKINTSHKFTIFLKTPPISDLPPEKTNWTYRIIPFPKLWTQTRLPFDLFFHKPQPDIFLSLTHYAPRWSPVPAVVAIMDLGFLKYPNQFTPKDFTQLKNWTSYSVNKATKVIAISEHTKKDICAVYHKSPEDVIVTYLGYDTELYRPTTNPLVLKKYAINTPYFLFLGSLKPSKNIENLLEAFNKINHTNYSLVIAGKKAWLYDKIFSRVKKLGLLNKVIFTGFTPDEDIPPLMTHSTAFVLPSLYEGFGIPVLEAMACGTPVVVSNVASLPEVAGEAGIYVDPYSVDSITQGLQVAISNKSSQFVKRGLSRVKSFNWDETAKKTLSLLENIYHNKP
jgi:glycosyltransferase involved in cell wall biosynthesis